MRRPTLRFAAVCASLLICANVLALSLNDLSQQDATGGLKDALTQGAQIAVKQLGTPGGFSNNPDVKIELPGKLGKAASKMKAFGMGAQVGRHRDRTHVDRAARRQRGRPGLLVGRIPRKDRRAGLNGWRDVPEDAVRLHRRDATRRRFD